MKRTIIPLTVVVFGILLSGQAIAQSCSIDVFGLEVNSNSMTGSIKNLGQDQISVTYWFEVNGKEAGNGYFYLEPDETKEAKNSFSFPVGEHTVKLHAISSCSSSDSETIKHIVLESYSCTNPFGVENQNFCNYYSKECLVCRGGSWTPAGEYCLNCPFTCGDKVCNCGESIASCPQDCTCTRGFVDKFQCSGNLLQQSFQFNDCSSEWRTVQSCSSGCEDKACKSCREGHRPELICDGSVRKQKYVFADCTESYVTLERCSNGCSGGLCLEEGQTDCSVSLEAVDYVKSLNRWEKGYVTATVKNEGLWGRLNISFFLNGNDRGSDKFTLPQGSSATRTFFYFPLEGVNHGEVRARHACGAEDSFTFEINVEAEKTISLSPPEPPAPAERETSISILPQTLDVLLHTGKAISLDISTSEPQNFKIEVTGLPAGFAQHEQNIFVQDQAKTFVYITPKEVGSYTFTIKVTPENDEPFSQEIKLFSVTEGSPENAAEMELPWFFPILAAVVAIIVVVGIVISVIRRRCDAFTNYLWEREY